MNHRSLALATWMAGLLSFPILYLPVSLAVPSVAAQPDTSQLSPEQLQKLARSITVKVLSGDSSGSGILIKKEGQVYTVLTNQHVLTSGKPIRIQTSDGNFHQATLITGVNFQSKDLALLQFRASADYAVASLTNLTTVAVNEQIFAAGFPFEADSSQPSGFTLTTGQVLYVPERAFKEGYQIGYSNNIGKGMSGGPILNRQGQVIGINGIHADPLWGDPYVYEDGSRPTDAQRDLMSRYSWGIPIQTFAQLAPQYASPEALATGTPTATEENLPPIANDVNNIAQQITVLIRWAKGNGSGVIIGRKSDTYTVLTAEHVVRNKTSFEVVTPDGKNYLVTVDDKTVKNISGADLAIFQFRSNQNYRVATLANYVLQSNSGTGSDPGFIFVSGWAGTGGEAEEPRCLFSAGLVISNTFVSSLLAKNSLSLNYGYKLLYSNLTEGGMSGGPVLDIRGRVIGIHGRADDEEITDKAGRTRHVPLGFSLGVPISAFVNQFKEMGLEGELRVETFPPPPLTDEENQAILKALSNPKEPNANADAIDWLNYGWQVVRASEESENDEKKAIAAFDRAIQLKPDFHQAWLLRGLVLMLSQRNKETLQAFDKAIEIKPDFELAWRYRGLVLFSLERPQEALESFDRASQLDPKNLGTQIIRSLLLFISGRYSEALDAANRILEIRSIFWGYFIRASVRVQQGDLEGALADWNEAIRLDPKDAQNYNYRGIVYYAQKNYPAAIADYTEAIRLNPQDPVFYNNRGNAYRDQKNYQGAITDYTEAIRLNPKDDGNLRERSYVRRQLKDYQGALADSNEAIRLDPKDAQNYNYRGIVYYVQENYQAAIADYTEAIRLKPQDPVFYNNRGNAYRDQKNYRGAIADYTEAIHLDPKNAWHYNWRGLTYLKQENYQEALADFTKAIRLDPKNASSYLGRGKAYEAQENYQEAIADLTEAIRLDPKNDKNYYSRYLVHRKLGDLQGALADLNEVVSLDPDDAVNFRKRGDVRRQIKDYQGAIADYTEAIRLDPGYIEAHSARGLVRAAQEDYRGAVEDYNQVLRTQEIGRIGLQSEINTQTKIFTIVAVIDNSPAYKGGIKVGDQVLEIDNKPTANLSLEEVVNLLRGQMGTQVSLRISRPDKRESKVTLTRELIIEPQFAEVYYNRGLARLQLKDKQGAQEDLQTAANLYQQQNNTEMYQTALEKLKELQ